MLLFKRLDHCIARVAGRSVILFVLLGISACANLNTAYRARTHSAKSVSTISIDAKQRNIFFVPEWEKQNGNQMRMCAEASPDVFSALAASGGALVNVDAKAQAGSGQVGFSIAETAASIERTQTVNLLRESFYRTCERYLSGAIGKEAFSVQAGRDARAMVAVLAIEQLTGAIRRPSTIISGPATAVQLQTANNALALLGPAQERARDADAAVIKKLAEISSCSTKKGTDDKPLTKEQVDACVATGNAELKDLKAQRDRADAEVKQIVAVSGNVV
ncbi:hypothetical protein, partial [Sandarakinorhabdus sp.]|uniref:hypothetical protein n=1 Tax=Sandarakinorhabdus sp. TaxID=1916663 RepID=UPI00286DD491